MKAEILSLLPPDFPWRQQIQYFDAISSTNDLAKELAMAGAPHGTILIADRQTGGRGRMGRSFLSPGGMGVYLSVLLRPQCAPTELMHLTCAVAVAMCDAVEAAAGFRPGIKWTNDLVYDKHKLGGILTELSFGSSMDYAIAGIGINCCQQEEDFDPTIRQIASSLTMAAEKPISRSHLAAEMCRTLWEMDNKLISGKEQLMQRYRENCITLGQDISVVRQDSVQHGYALDIDENGALIVRMEDGGISTVNSGEVSVRGMYGYV